MFGKKDKDKKEKVLVEKVKKAKDIKIPIADETAELNKMVGVYGEKIVALQTALELAAKNVLLLEKENAKLLQANTDLSKQVAKLSKVKSGKLPNHDCGVVDGHVFKVARRDRASEIGLAVRRSEVDENATCLVLEAHND